jgi:hypothetical protein
LIKKNAESRGEKPLDYLIDKMAQEREPRQQTGTEGFDTRREKVRITKKSSGWIGFPCSKNCPGWWRSTD